MRTTLLLLSLIAPANASAACKQLPVLESASVSEAEMLKLQAEWKQAIDRDKTADLWRLLEVVDVKSTNDKGKTALMAAVKVGDECLIEELRRRGLRYSDKGYTGGTTLMYAVLGNQTAMIELVMAQQPELDAQSTNGWTAVMIAAAKGFKDSMDQLYRAGADINLPDVYRWTPLMRAIDNRHRSVVAYLLSLPELEVNLLNENGSTALHIAAQVGDQNTVRSLLSLGAEVTVIDVNGLTAESVASASGYSEIAQLIASFNGEAE